MPRIECPFNVPMRGTTCTPKIRIFCQKCSRITETKRSVLLPTEYTVLATMVFFKTNNITVVTCVVKRVGRLTEYVLTRTRGHWQQEASGETVNNCHPWNNFTNTRLYKKILISWLRDLGIRPPLSSRSTTTDINKKRTARFLHKFFRLWPVTRASILIENRNVNYSNNGVDCCLKIVG